MHPHRPPPRRTRFSSTMSNCLETGRCVAKKRLPLPEYLPKSLGGPGQSAGSIDDSQQSESQSKGSKARREAEEAREKEKRELARRTVRLREQTAAYRLGKVTAAAFYITLAEAFGARRQAMVPKVRWVGTYCSRQHAMRRGCKAMRGFRQYIGHLGHVGKPENITFICHGCQQAWQALDHTSYQTWFCLSLHPAYLTMVMDSDVLQEQFCVLALEPQGA